LRQVVELLEIERVIGVGRFAETVAKRALGDAVGFGMILHPSPASPAANRGWAEQAQGQLREQGLL
jgi:single-strand selective monofunctional uracil DNA glycosylase